MTSFPLEGSEGKIFLRALRRYSDECEAPALTPDCPFAIDIAPGRRGCGEECTDLLAQYGAPMSVEEVQLGKGVAIRPRIPRPRRRPEGPVKAFDAGEHLLIDQDLPITSWRSSSLLRFLMNLLMTPPPEDPEERAHRLDGIEGLMHELDTRGFDSEALLKDPGALVITSTIAMSLLVKLLLEAAETVEVDISQLPVVETQILDQWSPCLFPDGQLRLSGSPNQTSAELEHNANIITGLIERIPEISSVMSETSVHSIIDWTAPSTRRRFSPPEPDVNSRWALDRFTTTYLDAWDDSSLHCEWEWLHGKRVPPCDPREMHARVIDEGTLNAAIATRSVMGGSPRAGSPLAADSYVKPAVEMLREGRRQSAAAIFEAIARVSPHSRDAHNNLGFCLLPDEPEVALREFNLAAKLGMGDNCMNIANRMLALVYLRHFASALSLADKFYSSLDSVVAPVTCYMWSLDAPQEVVTVTNVRMYVAEVAEMAARLSNDQVLAEKWRDRANVFASAVKPR